MPVVIAPLLIYSDDTSGNRSKKWNKFDVWCISLACLPRDCIHDTTNIYFSCCSNRCNALQMLPPIVDDLSVLEKGLVMYVFLKTRIMVFSPVICLLCDNARASELINHLGSTATKLCCMCIVSIYVC